MAAAVTTRLSPRQKLRKGSELLATALAVVLFLNLFDTVATITWIELGVAEEANPLMAVLLAIHPTLFAVVKMLLVSCSVAILWHFRHHRASKIGTGLACAVYLGTYAVHAYGAVLVTSV